ncbi:MAG: methyltransferase domain-containing protein [Thermoleophilia bacterium]
MADASLAALRALAGGDRERAAAIAAADTGAGALAPALARHLSARPSDAVYDEAAAFASFIGNGDNPELYRRTIAALAKVHAGARPRSVLDIGPGDGRVTAAVLGPATTTVDLVEPSAALLTRARAALAGAPASVRPHGTGIREHLDAEPDATWDLAQSTFALHTLPPDARRAVLGRLASRTARLAVAEFDVPAFDGEDARLRYLAGRYERGVEVYRRHPEVVDGFLMPVLVGQVEPGRVRHTFEGPVAAWRDDLAGAGFGGVTAEPLHDHWWAPAVLLVATVV